MYNLCIYNIYIYNIFIYIYINVYNIYMYIYIYVYNNDGITIWFLLKLFSNKLLWWRPVLTNSDFLLSKLGSFNDFITYSFLERHNIQKFNFVFDNTFVTRLHSITCFHIYFNSSVLILYLGCLKSGMWKSWSH